jgi:uncharacterized protein (UPF0276 family)
MQDTFNNVPAQTIFPPATAPASPVGIGLRHPHFQDIIETAPAIGWLEVHPENFFGGGAPRRYLAEARKKYPLSLHAVGLSLGSDQPVDEKHLRALKELIDIYQPFNVSDHASWSASGNAHLGDLLPLPYTTETLDALCWNIERTQEFCGRTILVENPSTYIAFADNEMTEFEFMNRAAQKTGCGILLDINNIFVQAFNHGYDAFEYIGGIDAARVGEMHLAGHIEKDAGERTILIDTHNRPVRGEVWNLYEYAVRRLGPVPTLIEWDQDFPGLDGLLAEARRAEAIIAKVQAEGLAHAAE